MLKSENNNLQNKLEAKREKVLHKKKMRISKPAVVIGGILIIASGILLVFNRTKKPEAPSAAEVQTGTNNGFAYPVALFEDGKAKYFKYAKDGLTINYFILKSSDGIIRAAFDACDVCWRAGKGYYQDGDEMVCGNCGRRFASIRINEIQGGCNPAPLRRRIEGNNVIIAVGDIIEGNNYFDLSGGR